MILKRVGVVGAGFMRLGGVQALVQAQHDVALIGIHDDFLNRAEGQNFQNSHLNRLFYPQKEFDKTPDELISQITFTTDYQQLHDVVVLRDILH